MTEIVSLYPSTSPEQPEGEFVSVPGSPFELFMPYPPAGYQPEAYVPPMPCTVTARPEVTGSESAPNTRPLTAES